MANHRLNGHKCNCLACVRIAALSGGIAGSVWLSAHAALDHSQWGEPPHTHDEQPSTMPVNSSQVAQVSGARMSSGSAAFLGSGSLASENRSA
jgi:hypothetical protein